MKFKIQNSKFKIDFVVSGFMELFLESLLHIALVLPLLLIFMKERTTENYLRVLSIVVCYLVYYFALTLRYHFDCFDIIKGNWNWEVKI